MAGRASRRHARQPLKYLLRRLFLHDRVRKRVHVFVNRHAHLFEGQRQLRHDGGIGVRSHVHPDGPRRSFGLLKVRLCLAQTSDNTIHRLQELPHLREDLVAFHRGQEYFSAAIRPLRRPARHKEPPCQSQCGNPQPKHKPTKRARSVAHQ